MWGYSLYKYQHKLLWRATWLHGLFLQSLKFLTMFNVQDMKGTAVGWMNPKTPMTQICIGFQPSGYSLEFRVFYLFQFPRQLRFCHNWKFHRLTYWMLFINSFLLSLATEHWIGAPTSSHHPWLMNFALTVLFIPDWNYYCNYLFLKSHLVLCFSS